MTTSQNDALLSELNGNARLSVGTRAFLGARARNAVFTFIHNKLREAKAQGLTQAQLAERLGKDPGRLSNTLSSPGNWTIDTIAELLFGISKSELVLSDQPLLGRRAGNARATDLLDEPAEKLTTPKLAETRSDANVARIQTPELVQ